MAHTTPGTTTDPYLAATEYFDAEHPLVWATAAELTDGAAGDVERVGHIYHYVRSLPYDVLASFRYLAEGRRSASDVIEHGVAFCMGKASSFVALCRAAGVPARVAFQTLDSPGMEFISPAVRPLWGGKTGRPLSWHSLGEARLNGHWVKLDATIDPPTAARQGKPYRQDYDGVSDIQTVEGPILRENGSYPDYPPEVATWYESVARSVLHALTSPSTAAEIAGDDALWAGPDLDQVMRRAVA